MATILKICLSVVMIMTASEIAKKLPNLAGLLAVMPLTGLMVLIFVYFDSGGQQTAISEFAKGAMWGVLPTMAFFAAVWFCFARGFALPSALVVGFCVWFIAAFIHQRFI